MDDEQALEKLKDCEQMGQEEGHAEADGLLCELLKDTHPKTVAYYIKLPKWYA